MNSYLIRILSATSILVLLSACTGGTPQPVQVDKTLPKVANCSSFSWSLFIKHLTYHYVQILISLLTSFLQNFAKGQMLHLGLRGLQYFLPTSQHKLLTIPGNPGFSSLAFTIV